MKRRWLFLAVLAVSSGCVSSAPSGAAPSSDDALARVTTIHGGAGPWVIAGYPMGEYALARLGLERQSFDLEVVHPTPQAPATPSP